MVDSVVGTPPCLGIRTSEVVSGFYSFLGFPRLSTSHAIRRSIIEGVQKGVLGYSIGNPVLGGDGKFQLDRSKVAFELPLAEDEVDLDSGFLIVPSAVPALVVPVPPGGPPRPGGEPPEAPEPRVIPPAGESTQDGTVEFSFEADRNQLYTAWSAIANLADLVGKVKVSITANSDKDFDKNRLENGVLEPLRESKLID